MGSFKSFFEELKRRNIYKVAIAYGITGWVVIQMGAIASNAFGAPPWVMKMIITVILLGFPFALVFAWAFEITPEGIRRTHKVPKERSITKQTGKQLNYWIIGLLSTALIFLLVDRFWLGGSPATPSLNDSTEAIPSVAVLPFEDFSREGNQEWFSDGLTEELLNSLARLQGLKVAARTSSFHFKNKNIPIQRIADTLDVTHIVEGSVRRADSSMRITAQLIRASDGFHEWSRTYERNVNDVFKVQEDISENIASALNVYLDEEARQRMFAFGTRNVEAYNAYLKGRNVYDNLHKGQLDSANLLKKANPWFEKATKLDPAFSAPYYYHSDAYLHYIFDYPSFTLDTLSVDEARAKMLADFDKAIAHAKVPGLKLMYQFEQTFFSNNWSELPELIQELKHNQAAQRAYSMLGGGWTRSFLTLAGHARLQYKLSKQALKRDPLDASFRESMLQALISYAPLDTVFKALKTFSDEYGGTNFSVRCFLYLRHGKIAKADSMANLVDTSATHPLQIFVQAVRGNQKKARQNFAKFEAKEWKNSFGSAIGWYALGKKEKARSLAMEIDTSVLGPQQLMTNLTGLSGLLGFDPKEMPNLSVRFQEAGVQVGYKKIGAVRFPIIVQKE